MPAHEKVDDVNDGKAAKHENAFLRYSLEGLNFLNLVLFVGQLKIIPLHFIISRNGNSSCFEECSVDNYDFYAAAFHGFTNGEGEKKKHSNKIRG